MLCNVTISESLIAAFLRSRAHSQIRRYKTERKLRPRWVSTVLLLCLIRMEIWTCAWKSVVSWMVGSGWSGMFLFTSVGDIWVGCTSVLRTFAHGLTPRSSGHLDLNPCTFLLRTIHGRVRCKLPRFVSCTLLELHNSILGISKTCEPPRWCSPCLSKSRQCFPESSHPCPWHLQ